MKSDTIRVLVIAPYQILPAVSGGQMCIAHFAAALGKICPVHVLSTDNNTDADAWHFTLHRVFPNAAKRYLPGFGFKKVLRLARNLQITHLICEHPYMAPLANKLSRAMNIPWVLQSHNIEADRFRQLKKPWWYGVKLFERFALNRANAAFFLTQEDEVRAQQLYKISPEKCFVLPYGTSLDAAPAGHLEAKKELATTLSLDQSIPWIYFLGMQHYAPNAEAVATIVREILPRLNAMAYSCELFIAGKGLSEGLQNEIKLAGDNIRYLGFVENLEQFIKACDIMLNPVCTGGGIKTKAVEALAYDKTVFSTVHGAAGILPEVCGANLIITADGDWDGMVQALIHASKAKATIPQSFFEYYNWENIATRAFEILLSLQKAK
ncbi:MAG: glycosyltransferase family 4 protein [Bacteroidetes bacterium]|nr:glycosyltransferase family 4 protein [Bacteroidota bacterium]